MTRSSIWTKLIIGSSLAFLYLPLVVVAILSFSDRRTPLFPLGAFTFDWYSGLITDERVVETAERSLTVAALSTLIGLVIGTLSALSLTKLRGRTAATIGGLFAAPNLVPNLVLGVAMALTFSMYGIGLSIGTVIIGHSLLTSALIFLLVSARLRGFDWSVVEAGRVLGAGAFEAFRRVTLPLLLPAVAGGALLGFALSLDNFVLSFFLTGGDSTLPLLMWSMMREGFSPTLNAIATILLLGTLVLAFAGEHLVRRGPRDSEATSQEAE